jgi:serine/threonine-protein kinase
MEPVSTGRVFSNRYELTHLIARGGMAQVFRARDRLLDRPVAIKVLFPELSVDRAFVERFRREAQAAANLSHPNIVPVFDWGEDGGTYFIVMEYVDGQPLSAVLRSTGPMGPGRVADIGIHVAAALAFAHRHGVIHRDIKPGNVLITSEGQVKVTDFGIARAVNTEESLTQTGAVMGTATYFSPEQAEGVGVDSRSDIYSLGVVLYEMVAGRPPFLGDTPVAVASKHVRDQPPALRDLAPAVPAALEAVIMKAMAKSAADRYPNADELRADLVRFSEGLPVTAAEVESTRVEQAVGATGVQTAVGSSRAVPIADPEFFGALGTEEADRRRRTRRMVGTLVALLVVLIVVAVLLGSSLGWFGSGKFALSNMVGRTRAAATSALEAKGLTVADKSQTSTAAQDGKVLATTPVPGTTVSKGQQVTLVVGSGPAPVVKVLVPSVVGTSLSAAEKVLHDGKLKYTVKFVTSTKPATTVVAQTPKPGKTVPAGTLVTLSAPTVATTVKIPSVVGLAVATAGVAFGTVGLKVGPQTQVCSTTIKKGSVISQTPAAGGKLAKTSTVSLVVSSGPCKAPVKLVIGTTATAARLKLATQGFTNVTAVTTTTCKPATDGKVASQTPKAGTTWTTSKPVTYTVCNAPIAPAFTLLITGYPGAVTKGDTYDITLAVALTSTGGAAKSHPALRASLATGEKWGTVSTVGKVWSCARSNGTKTLVCTSTKTTPVAKGTSLGVIKVPVSVSTTAKSTTLLKTTATVSDAADGAATVQRTYAVKVNP